MKQLILLTLFVFAAPFGWGEEGVYYCVEENSLIITVLSVSRVSEESDYTQRKYTVALTSNELQVKYRSGSYSADHAFDLIHDYAYTHTGVITNYEAQGMTGVFTLSTLPSQFGFQLLEIGSDITWLRNGSCTKF